MLAFSKNPDVAEQQMRALIYYLTAFGYIDGDFDLSEKTFVRSYIRELVEDRARQAMPNATDAARAEVVTKFTSHFHEVFQEIDWSVRSLFDEVVSKGEDLDQFVYAKLKLRCYEIFKAFDPGNQQALLATVDELIAADGQVHAAEAKFRDEIRVLLTAEIPLDERDVVHVDSDLHIGEPMPIAPRQDDHPFFQQFEFHYSADPVRIRKQAEGDFQLIQRTMAKLEEQRAAGAGKLAGKHSVAELAAEAPFLDG
ncbi:MAG: serine/threonine protein phosphatase, partial [Bryobacteraceae bacterium]